MLFGPRSFVINPDILARPSQALVHTLCDIFAYNVDRVIKILHMPSIRQYMQEGGPYLDYSPGTPSVEALSFAIYHAAVTSISEVECRQQLGQAKSVLLAKYRFATEVSLANADMVNTDDITTLQALVILIVSFSIVSSFPLDLTAHCRHLFASKTKVAGPGP